MHECFFYHSLTLVEKLLHNINCACSSNYCPEPNEYVSLVLNQTPKCAIFFFTFYLKNVPKNK